MGCLTSHLMLFLLSRCSLALESSRSLITVQRQDEAFGSDLSDFQALWENQQSFGQVKYPIKVGVPDDKNMFKGFRNFPGILLKSLHRVRERSRATENFSLASLTAFFWFVSGGPPEWGAGCCFQPSGRPCPAVGERRPAGCLVGKHHWLG